MAHAWFIDHRFGGWATCPVTESGFVRVSSNVKAIPAAVSPAAALELLIQLRRQPGHVFWPDDVSLADSSHVPRDRLVSYTQVTDAHLLALVRQHSSRIATFDRGLVALAEPTQDQDILLLDQLPRQRGSRT